MTHLIADVIVIGAVLFWPIAVVISLVMAVFGDDDPPPKKTIWNAGYTNPVANVAYSEELAAWEERRAARQHGPRAAG